MFHFKPLASILEAFSEKRSASSLRSGLAFSHSSVYRRLLEQKNHLKPLKKNHEMKGSHILTIFGVWAGLCFPGNIVTFYFLQKTTELGNTTFNALEINETIFETMKDEPQDDNLTVLQSKKS